MSDYRTLDELLAEEEAADAETPAAEATPAGEGGEVRPGEVELPEDVQELMARREALAQELAVLTGKAPKPGEDEAFQRRFPVHQRPRPERRARRMSPLRADTTEPRPPFGRMAPLRSAPAPAPAPRRRMAPLRTEPPAPADPRPRQAPLRVEPGTHPGASRMPDLETDATRATPGAPGRRLPPLRAEAPAPAPSRRRLPPLQAEAAPSSPPPRCLPPLRADAPAPPGPRHRGMELAIEPSARRQVGRTSAALHPLRPDERLKTGALRVDGPATPVRSSGSSSPPLPLAGRTLAPAGRSLPPAGTPPPGDPRRPAAATPPPAMGVAAPAPLQVGGATAIVGDADVGIERQSLPPRSRSALALDARPGTSAGDRFFSLERGTVSPHRSAMTLSTSDSLSTTTTDDEGRARRLAERARQRRAGRWS